MSWNPFKHKSLRSKVENAVSGLPWNISAEKIIELLKPAIGIRTLISEGEIGIGRSKFGGLPDLPADVKWPGLNDIPFAFAGQINLAELEGLDTNNNLPESGILYFFFTANNPDYENELVETIHKVIFYDGELSGLKTQDYPKNYLEFVKFKMCKLNFFEHYTFPSYENYQVMNLNLSIDDEEQIWEIDEVINDLTGGDIDVQHQLLGNAQAVQGDVDGHWAFRRLKLKSYALYDIHREQISALENKFVLLFQADLADRNPGFNAFGGSARIYFGITKEDLKDKRFDKTEFVLQNT